MGIYGACGANAGRGPKLNTNFLFSNFSVAPGISWQNPGISRQTVWFSGFRGTYQTFWPPPLHVEDALPHRKISGPKSFEFGFLFLACGGSGRNLRDSASRRGTLQDNSRGQHLPNSLLRRTLPVGAKPFETPSHPKSQVFPKTPGSLIAQVRFMQ